MIQAVSLPLIAVALSSGLASCHGERRADLSTLVKQTEDGILFDYEIIPKNPEERRKSRFRIYAFSRSGGSTLYSPILSDERWLEHYRNLRALFGQPLDNMTLEDVDPLMGMFAYRVHPVTLVPRHHHTGVDIFKPAGTEVKAVYEGVVERHKDAYGGNWVKLIHPIKTKDGYHVETRYLHLETIDEKVVDGTKVTKGQVLGKLGGTGIMEGYFPHLHLEVVMINNSESGSGPLVLDANRIYFDPPEQTGFFRRFFPPDQQSYFRNLTKDIKGDNVPEQLADLLNGLSAHDKKFLPLYVEYWKYAAGKNRGQGQYSALLQRLNQR
jgi:murein DD-endopeptidase MepM/ murein hydrolase activator NlpD